MHEFESDPDFSGSYAKARERFLAAARAAGARLEHHVHPLRGIDGEELAADVAAFGPAGGADLLLVQSGTHGVEGHCGSGIQHALLDRPGPLQRAIEADMRVVLLHAINPWGFSWTRRVTEDNVDLNRNFRDFSAPGGPDADYDEVHPLVLPAEWPWTDANRGAIASFLATRGLGQWQYAVSHGQRSRADGLFYAGQGPTWSNRTLRSILRRHAAGARRIFWIDFHTGLGPSGVGEMIYCGRDVPADLARTRACWGDAVTSVFEGSSTSAMVEGQVGNAAYEECPQAAYVGMSLEYGTQPFERVIDALRFEQWVQLHAADDRGLLEQARQAMREAFYVDTPQWKEAVVAQGIAGFERAAGYAASVRP